MNKFEYVLGMLEGVRRSKAGSAMALCPAHKDRSPSLSISEADDYRVLIHCFAGCDVHSVLAALDLSPRDLFPNDVSVRYSRLSNLKRKQLESLYFKESLLIEMYQNARTHGLEISTQDQSAFSQARERVTKIREMLND